MTKLIALTMAVLFAFAGPVLGAVPPQDNVATANQKATEIVTPIGVTVTMDLPVEVTTPGGFVVEVTRPHLVTFVGVTADGTLLVKIQPIDVDEDEEIAYLLPVDSENPGYIWVLETADGIAWGTTPGQADGIAEKLGIGRDGHPVFSEPQSLSRDVNR